MHKRAAGHPSYKHFRHALADIRRLEKNLNNLDSQWRKRPETLMQVDKLEKIVKGRDNWDLFRSFIIVSKPLYGPSFVEYADWVLPAIQEHRGLFPYRTMAEDLGLSGFHRDLEEYQRRTKEYWMKYRDLSTPDTVFIRMERDLARIYGRAKATVFQTCLLRHVDRASELKYAATTRRQVEDAKTEIDQNRTACYEEAQDLDLSVK